MSSRKRVALNLAELQQENGHGNHMSSSPPQLCGGDQSHVAFVLRQSESELHFYPFAFIPAVLSLVSEFSLPGAS